MVTDGLRFGVLGALAHESHGHRHWADVCLGVDRCKLSCPPAYGTDILQPPSESPNHRRAPSIIPLLPILLLLVIPTLILPPVFLFLLKKTVRPVLLATSISVPFALFVCGWWALGASFESVGDADQTDRWWATRGLQLGAVVLWLLSAWFARLLWLRRRKLERTVTVVEVSCHCFHPLTPHSSQPISSSPTLHCCF